MEKADIHPKLSLGVKKEGGGVESTGPHRVKMVRDKIVNGVDRETLEQIQYVKYIVEEDGTTKEYKVPMINKDTGELHYLVQHLAQVGEGDEVILEMKRRGQRNYVEVRLPDGTPLSGEVENEERTESSGDGEDTISFDEFDEEGEQEGTNS